MTENERIIKTQQRTIQKYEKTLSEIRMLCQGAKALRCGAQSHDHLPGRLNSGAPFLMTYMGEIKAVVLPLDDLKKLGMING